MSETGAEQQPDFFERSEYVILATIAYPEYAPAIEASGLAADDFYIPANKILYQTILDLYHKYGKYDIVVITNALSEAGKLEAVGGHYGVSHALTSELMHMSPEMRDMHIATVRDAARRRRAVVAIDAANNMLKRKDMRGVTALQDAIAELSGTADNEHGFKPFILSAGKVLAELEREIAAQTYITGIRSGYYRLDALTAGFQPGNVYIFAARPSMGKTALALNMLQNMVLHPNEGTQPPRVAFISAEMSSAGLFRRMISAEAGVDLRSMVQTRLTGDMNKVSKAFRRLKEQCASMEVIEAQGMNIDQIAASLRYAHQANPFDIVFLDYLQLIPATGSKAQESTVEQVAEISRKLHALAVNVNLPFVVLAQINRDASGRTPTMSNIKGSGSVEQDADVVVLIDRPEKYLDDESGDDERESFRGLVVLDVAKNRNGATGRVLLHFDAPTQKFFDRPDQTMPKRACSTKPKNKYRSK